MATSPTSGPGGDGGGLPTGWTQDASDPANVSTEGGELALDQADLTGLNTLMGTGGEEIGLAGDGSIELTAPVGGGVFLSGPIVELDGPVVRVSGATAAPADAALSASEFVLWLDATPGVGNTKLMVKAKDSAGTVRQAAVVLA